MTWLLLGVAFLLIAAAVAMRRSTGLPWRRVRYRDTQAWRRAERPLVAHRYGLVGRPDYLIQAGDSVIPVEVKPSRRANEPYASDLMQLAAYCLLVEETMGARPPYGVLRYAEATFHAPFSDRLRDQLLATLNEMRLAERNRASNRSHRQPARCSGCGFVRKCDQALA